jgi:flagellar basal-body rod protein FlgB
MTDSIVSDSAISAASFALDGLSRRQEVIGQNLANVDTPGYQAQAVNFEDALKRSLNNNQRLQPVATNPAHITTTSSDPLVQTIPREGGSQRADGNDVDINVELNQMSETGIKYQAITQLISQKFLLLNALSESR